MAQVNASIMMAKSRVVVSHVRQWCASGLMSVYKKPPVNPTRNKRLTGVPEAMNRGTIQLNISVDCFN
jgi:hypothetical protein